MYRLERNEIVESSYPALWSLLAFQAGHINTLGFLICGRYVTHITGFGTAIGHAISGQNISLALQLISFPASFIFGSFFSSFFTSARLERNKMPAYSFIAFLLPFLLFIAILIGMLGVFSPMGSEVLESHDYALVLFLVFLTGMQNGCFAILTKGNVRTTHLTGTGTDFGVDLARLWFGQLDEQERKLTSQINRLRCAILLCFAVGAVVAGSVSEQIGHGALLIPFATSLVAFLAVLRLQRRIKLRVERATPLKDRLSARAQSPR